MTRPVRRLAPAALIAALTLVAAMSARAADIGTAFSYQGFLEKPAGTPVDGVSCDFRFGLWDAAAGGNQAGVSPQTKIGVGVTAGVFTVPDLDFGAGAIDGAARWLEIEVKCPPDVGFTLLIPCVALTPAPHALALPGLYTQQNATSPNLIGGYSGNTVTVGAVGATIGGGGVSASTNRVTDDYGTVGGGVTNRAGDNAGTTADREYATVGGGAFNRASGFAATIGGGYNCNASGEQATIGGGYQNTASGYTSTVGGGAVNLSTGEWSTVPGGYGNWAGGRLSFAAGYGAKVRDAAASGDSNGDEGTFVWSDGNMGNPFTSTGPNQFLIHAAGGVGIGTNTPDLMLEIAGDFGRNDGPATVWLFGSEIADVGGGTLHIRSGGPFVTFDGGDNVGIGDTTPDARLDVEADSAVVAKFNRTGDFGSVVHFEDDGVVVGIISFNLAGVMTYGTFTGSHLAWTEQPIEDSALVSLTGSNRRWHDLPNAEIVYGITPSAVPNDPKCLGAYLGLLEPAKPFDADNPHQVASVGNGDMWVVETGRNIEPGQYLISSDLKGHAMLDDENRFPVGHVIARAGEPVDWSTVTDTMDGHKHKRVSVFFESFERGSAVGLGKIVEQQQARIEALERAGNGSVVRAGLPLALIAVVGLVAFRRRSTKGGAR